VSRERRGWHVGGWGAAHACGTEEGTRVRGGGIRG
jgi:hypothetical protein